jgi:predicted nicotinamide N-methyase
MPVQVRTHVLQIAGRRIELAMPADPEALLDDALKDATQTGLSQDPYWGILWDSAPRLAELILQTHWPGPLRTAELGCGVGLAGIAALLAGHDVTFSDHSADAVDVAQSNADRNGFDRPPGLVFEWQEPPALGFDFLIASDVLYDVTSHTALLKTLKTMLLPGGTVWIGESGRSSATLFVQQARAEGWEVSFRDATSLPLTDPPHLEFRLIVMRWP